MFDDSAPNESLAAHNISMPVIVGLEAAALNTRGTSGIKLGPKSRVPVNVTDSVDKGIAERKEKSSIRADGRDGDVFLSGDVVDNQMPKSKKSKKGKGKGKEKAVAPVEVEGPVASGSGTVLDEGYAIEVDAVGEVDEEFINSGLGQLMDYQSSLAGDYENDEVKEEDDV